MSSGYYTRSKALTEHKAAGVLPYALHEGSVLVLLGGEPCRTGPRGKVWRTMWRDFGGGREAADADSAATAAREFAEETLGLFGACGVDQRAVEAAAAVAEARLRDPHLALKVVHSLKKGAYHLYLTQQPFIAPLMFRLATQQNAATRAVAGGEKTAFAWVPFKALLACVASASSRYFLVTRAHVCGGDGTPQPSATGSFRFQLHPCFASSLRAAQSCGLDELLARAEELPLPPPPPLPLPLPPLLLAPAAEPAASVQGAAGTADGGLEETAVDSAAAAVDDDSSEEGEVEAAEEEEGSALFEIGSSCGYWLAQEGIAAALQSGYPTGAAAQLPSGLFLLPQPQLMQPLQQERLQQTTAASGSTQQQQQSPLACSPGAAAVPRWGQAAAAPAASGSSLARPASSLDTASSLRASRQAVAAAAVDQVRQQIEVNSHTVQRHRRSRKQRMKQRRQKQRAAEATAAAAEAAMQAAATAAAAAAQSPGKRPRQECVPSVAAAQYWQRAAAELEAAFQPRLRHSKRLRLVVADG